MNAEVQLNVEFSYFYASQDYLQAQSSGDGAPAYAGFEQSELVERFTNTFTTVASLTSFITKITGIPAASQKLAIGTATAALDMTDPGRDLTQMGLEDGSTVVLQTFRFPGPYDYSQLGPAAQTALMDAYPPPVGLHDLSTDGKLNWAEWESNTADTNIYLGALNLAPHNKAYAAYPFAQQFFNPGNPATQAGPISVTKVIAWNGLPGLLRTVTPYEELYKLADEVSDIGERQQQTEYCEWKAFHTDDGTRVEKIVLTCEGPEYWQQLFKADSDRCVALYRELTGVQTITADDLIAKEDVRIGGQVFVPKGSYNYYNRYNTCDGIVHLNQHNNFLSAELNIATMSSQLQQQVDAQGNLTVLEEALPLVLAGRYGSPGRNSDPTIGFVCNWIARHPLGLRLTIQKHVALYFGLLNTSGWTVPDGTIDDWVRCVRGEAATGHGLRYEISPPAGSTHLVDDILIAGEPLRYGGQAARCMTVQLTGQASPFSPGVGPPVRPRQAIQSRMLATDPISEQPVGGVLKDHEGGSMGEPTPTGAGITRVPVTEEQIPQNQLVNENPPSESPSEAYRMVLEEEREIVLDVDDIQGDPLLGFNTSHSIILFFDITDEDRVKAWLRAEVMPNITTCRDVLDRHAHMRAHRDGKDSATDGDAPAAPDYTYLNISFSRPGLEKLVATTEVQQFYALGDAEAFWRGMPERSTLLGDPEPGSGQPGDRTQWVVGGETTPDMMVQIQADTTERAHALAEAIKDSAEDVVTLVFQDDGHRREGPIDKPKEQFGFHDGISNPDVRGMYRAADGELRHLRRRLIDKSDHRWNTYAKPGTNLVWPGEILHGHKRQRNLERTTPAPQPQHYLLPDAGVRPGPSWAKNGTFVVYRRLQQDVAAFWNHAKDGATEMNSQFGAQGAPANMDPTRMAANFIGRWPSGCPVMLSPDKDVEAWGEDPMTQNAFNYATDTPPFPSTHTSLPLADVPTIPQDNVGLRCPMGAHVRKVNPRDQGTDFGPHEDTLTHRFIRRGTPFGEFVDEDKKFIPDGKDRGLQFIAYMASIDMQFEFVIRFWANLDQAPVAMTSGTANDMVIGQTAYDDYRRKLTAMALNGEGVPVVATTSETQRRWVTASGGGYFFMPSLTALREQLCG